MVTNIDNVKVLLVKVNCMYVCLELDINKSSFVFNM